MSEGFKVVGVKHNWDIPSKEGFVYFSTAYAPTFASECDVDEDMLALIKVDIDECDLYPEDDFLMFVDGKPKYTADDLAQINFEKNKHLWRASLKHLGNVSAKPNKVRIIGVTYFSGLDLITKYDPIITPVNFKFFGKYYEELSNWIFDGKPIKDFPDVNTFIFGADAMKQLVEDNKKLLEARNE
jgi:hypothetical protein